MGVEETDRDVCNVASFGCWEGGEGDGEEVRALLLNMVRFSFFFCRFSMFGWLHGAYKMFSSLHTRLNRTILRPR